jgi:hypothetical protein
VFAQPVSGVVPREVPAARQRNRADHYWPLVEQATGRKTLRHAKDYIAALLSDQPDELVEEALRAVEEIVGVNHERK